jgi:hypothetical protein
MEYPRIDNIAVLCHEGAETATLFTLVDGKPRHETIGTRQLLNLIETAAESLARMHHGKKT